jgi:hypothetical protein
MMLRIMNGEVVEEEEEPVADLPPAPTSAAPGLPTASGNTAGLNVPEAPFRSRAATNTLGDLLFLLDPDDEDDGYGARFPTGIYTRGGR